MIKEIIEYAVREIVKAVSVIAIVIGIIVAVIAILGLSSSLAKAQSGYYDVYGPSGYQGYVIQYPGTIHVQPVQPVPDHIGEMARQERRRQEQHDRDERLRMQREFENWSRRTYGN